MFDPYIQTTKDTVPASTAGVGTITSTGKSVVGTASVAKVVTTTLTGVSGYGTITIQGVPFKVPFIESLVQTAKSFVKASGMKVKDLGIDVYAEAGQLIFTAQKAGVDYTVSNVINVVTDLAGTSAVTTANVIGVNFLDLPSLFWIYDAAQSEVRRVAYVGSNNTLQLEKAFTADLAGVAFVYVGGSATDPFAAMPREFSLTNAGPADATINGKTNQFLDGLTVTNSEIMISRGGFRDRVQPIVLDATGTNVAVTLIY